MKLTKREAQEVLHKLCILADEPELQESYVINQKQADELLKSLPVDGGLWAIPDYGLQAVVGEMENACEILRDMANDQFANDRAGQALAEIRMAESFAKKFNP